MRDLPSADSCSPSTHIKPPEGRKARRWAVRLFRAMADETRMEILALIAAASEPICVCDIAACLDVSQPAVSHHLRILRDEGLVSAKRRGTWAFYSLESDGVDAVNEAVAHVFPGVRVLG